MSTVSVGVSNNFNCDTCLAPFMLCLIGQSSTLANLNDQFGVCSILHELRYDLASSLSAWCAMCVVDWAGVSAVPRSCWLHYNFVQGVVSGLSNSDRVRVAVLCQDIFVGHPGTPTVLLTTELPFPLRIRCNAAQYFNRVQILYFYLTCSLTLPFFSTSDPRNGTLPAACKDTSWSSSDACDRADAHLCSTTIMSKNNEVTVTDPCSAFHPLQACFTALVSGPSTPACYRTPCFWPFFGSRRTIFYSVLEHIRVTSPAPLSCHPCQWYFYCSLSAAEAVFAPDVPSCQLKSRAAQRPLRRSSSASLAASVISSGFAAAFVYAASESSGATAWRASLRLSLRMFFKRSCFHPEW